MILQPPKFQLNILDKYLCKGKDENSNDDITGEIKNEIKRTKKNGGKIVFTEELLLVPRLINRSTNFSHLIKKN